MDPAAYVDLCLASKYNNFKLLVRGWKYLAFNRNKTVTKAQKLLQKGKVRDAIKLYQEVVDSDPNDVRTQLKIGDLQAKVGEIEEATSTYEAVASHYSRDGFFLKAVAVYKQILKLDPGLIRIYVSLGELYQQLGLINEAMKQFQVVVKHYESQGLVKESLDTLKKMTQLEPENYTNKIKLAELYHKEGHEDDSKELFLGIAEELKTQQNTQELSRVYDKMKKLALVDDSVEYSLIETCLESGETKRALSRLQELFQKDEKNLRVLELLAKCFSELAQPQKARSVYKEMIVIADSQGLSTEKDKFEAKLRAMDLMSDDEVVSNVGSEEAPVLQTAVQFKDEISEEEKEIENKAEGVESHSVAEVDTLLEYGLIEKSLLVLSTILSKDPSTLEARKKLIQVCEQHGMQVKCIEILETTKSVAEERNLPDLVAEITEELSSFHSNSDKTQVVAKGDLQALETVVEFSNLGMDELDIIDDLEDELGVEEEEQVVMPKASKDEPVQAENVEDTARLEVSVEAMKNTAVVGEVDSEKDVDIDGEFLFDDVSDGELDEAFSVDAFERKVNEESSGEEFELSPMDISMETTEGPNEMEEGVSINEAAVNENETKSPEIEDEELDVDLINLGSGDAAEAEEVIVAEAQGPSSIDDLSDLEDDEIFILGEAPKAEPLEEEAGSSELIDLHAARNDASIEGGSEEDDLFDLSAELQDEIQDLEDELAKPKSDEDYLNPEEVISEFKKGVSRTVARDDYQTHYNLGIAYKEMGLLDEAINEFTVAGQNTELAGDCSSMIGLCYVSKRDFKKAIAVYKQSLLHTSSEQDAYHGLCYQLAEAYLGNGEIKEAYTLFVKVIEREPGFRDVKRRAKELAVDLGEDTNLKTSSRQESKGTDDKSDEDKSDVQNKVSFI